MNYGNFILISLLIIIILGLISFSLVFLNSTRFRFLKNYEGRDYLVLIQTIVLVMAFIAALIIGVRQYQISRELIELSSEPSIGIMYNNDYHKLVISNLGRTNIFIGSVILYTGGMDEEKAKKEIAATWEDKDYAMIAQQTNFLYHDDYKQKFLEMFGENAEERVSAGTFFKSLDKKYIAEFEFLIKISEGNMAIIIRLSSIKQSNW